jgi:hypothetical protein
MSRHSRGSKLVLQLEKHRCGWKELLNNHFILRAPSSESPGLLVRGSSLLSKTELI